MKLIYIIILFLIAFKVTLGQNKELNVPDEKFFIENSENHKKYCQELKIIYPPSDTNNFFFRFNDYKQYTDIWTNDFKKFYGCITNRAYKINKKHDKPDRLYTNQLLIDSLMAEKVYKLIISDSMLPVLLEKNIKEDDFYRYEGFSFHMELSTKNIYIRKTYKEEDLPDTMTESRKLVNSFVIELRRLLTLDIIHFKFFSKLPYGAYRADGMYVFSHSRRHDRYLRKRYKTEAFK